MPSNAQIAALTPVLINGNLDIVTIPLSNQLPWYTFTIALSGVIFTLRLRYNSRNTRWMMDVADAQNNDIINGITLLIDTNLLGQYVQPNLPLGMFFVVDNTGQNTQPTLLSFGTTHSLYYYDPYGLT
jgi:hypothetical protein